MGCPEGDGRRKAVESIIAVVLGDKALALTTRRRGGQGAPGLGGGLDRALVRAAGELRPGRRATEPGGGGEGRSAERARPRAAGGDLALVRAGREAVREATRRCDSTPASPGPTRSSASPISRR